MQKLEQLILLLENEIEHCDKENKNISEASVGWHIEHCTKVIARVTNAIKNANPAEFKSKFNFVKFIIFATNKIPRGKGKAPKASLPEGEINIEILKNNITKAREKVKELYLLDENKYFEHPYFGQIKLKDSIKFLKIHTNHHLKIIADILK